MGGAAYVIKIMFVKSKHVFRFNLLSSDLFNTHYSAFSDFSIVTSYGISDFLQDLRTDDALLQLFVLHGNIVSSRTVRPHLQKDSDLAV
jgi:hypothetical protein